MSGPVSSNEVEDFVSSVRRLVSTDERPRPTSRDLAQDRLVLGQAFRIVPDASDTVEPLLLTTPVKDVEPAASFSPPEMPAEPDPTVAVTSQAFEAEWEEEIWTEPDPPLSELALGAEEAEVVVETAEEGSRDRIAGDAEPEKHNTGWAGTEENWLEDLAATDAPVASPAQAPGEAAEKSAARPDVLKLSAEDMLTDGEGNPLTVLDEAALQQIIRQLIREELKGVLGERITQSVRKLVRAEINRALAAHALD
jgi:hypothetical protein